MVQDGQYKISLWRNQGQSSDYLSAKPAKTYTDNEGNPRDTQNFSIADMLPLSRLCEVAYERGRELQYEIKQEHRALQFQNTQPEYQPPAPAQNENTQRQQYQEMRAAPQEQQPMQAQTQTPRQS